jgi:RNase P subunit RPR2
MKKQLCCQQEENLKYEWVTKRNGSRHVTATCRKCGTYHQYVKQEEIDLDKVKEKPTSNSLF